MFRSVRPTAIEVVEAMPGDELVDADVVMDRAFSVRATPQEVWPWITQLGKGRAGWYLPQRIESALPRKNRAVRELDDRFTRLEVGDVVPDYGRDETLTVAAINEPRSVVFRGERKTVHLTWAIALDPEGDNTRVRLRLRLGPVKRIWLARSVGEAFDAATIAGMAAGLRERIGR